MYLEIEDVVNGPGRSAIRKRGPGIYHLIGYDPKGPPVTLNPIRAVGAPIHGCQDLWREEVLGPNGYCGSCHLKTHQSDLMMSLSNILKLSVEQTIIYLLFC